MTPSPTPHSYASYTQRLDGLEEFEYKCQAIKYLLSGQYDVESGKEMKIIVASRPCAMLDMLGEDVDTPVEITGFTEAAVGNYIEKYVQEITALDVNVKEDRLDALNRLVLPGQYLDEDEAGVAIKITEIERAAKMPVTLMMLCAITFCTDEPIPTSAAATYSASLDYIVQHTHRKNKAVTDTLVEAVGKVLHKSLCSENADSDGGSVGQQRFLTPAKIGTLAQQADIDAGLGFVQERKVLDGTTMFDVVPSVLADVMVAKHLVKTGDPSSYYDPELGDSMDMCAILLGAKAGPILTAAAEAASSADDALEKKCRMAISLRLLSYTGAPELAPLLSPAFGGEINLEHIDCRYHELTGLSQILAAGVNITALELGWNGIGNPGIALLFEGIAKSPTLTKVDLTKNDISTAGAAAIAKALNVNKVLVDLRLSWNQIDNEGSTLLAEALKTNTTLKKLRLKNNSVGEDGAEQLAAMLKLNNTLESLILWQNDIGNQGAAHLAEALKENTGLKELNVKKNGLEVDFEDFLCDAVKDKEDFKLGID